MRFSLQHLFVLLLLCASIVALDVHLYGAQDLRYWASTVFYLAGGFAVGLVFYIKWGRHAVAPLWPGLAGAGVVGVFCAGYAFLTDEPTEYICTRTQQIQSVRDLGLFRWSMIRDTENSRILRDELGYEPRHRRNWVFYAAFNRQLRLRYQDPTPYPMIHRTESELRALKVFTREQLSDLVELDSRYDVAMWKFREHCLCEHLRRERTFPMKSPEEFKAHLLDWHAKYAVFLKSFRGVEDVQSALHNYRLSPRWERFVDDFYCRTMSEQGIALPNDLPATPVR